MDIQEEIDRIDARWDDVQKKHDEMPDGLCVGKVVTFSVADGKAAYEVVEIGDKVSKVKPRDDLVLDNYRSDAVDHETGEILTSVLRRRIEQEETLSDIFG